MKNKRTIRYTVNNRDDMTDLEERCLLVDLITQPRDNFWGHKKITLQENKSVVQNIYTTTHERTNCIYCLRNHNGKKCDRPLCRWCNDIGHSSSKCTRLADPDRITLCKCFKNTYHSVNDCPCVWRKYKLQKPIDLTNIKKTCSNCSSDKHFTNDCVKEQNKFSIFNSQYLEDYSSFVNSRFEKD